MKKGLEEAARLVHQARGLVDQYRSVKDLPSEDRHTVDQMLSEAQRLRRAARGDVRDRDVFVPSLPAAKAFFRWLRGQSGRLVEPLTPEEKKLVEDATGQILVPEDVATPILKDIGRLGTMRSLVGAGARGTNRDRLKVRGLGPVTMSWRKLEVLASPTGLSDIEDSPVPEAIEIVVKNLSGLTKVGEDELDDSDGNLELLVRDVFASEVASEEDRVFAGGTAVDEPSGILGDTGVTVVASEAIGAISAEDLLEIQGAIDARFLRDAAYVASASVERKIMTLKDASGRHAFQFPTTPEAPAMVLGKPFLINDEMPAFNTGATRVKTLIFGDLERGYRIADRRRLTVKRLEELYQEEGLIGLKLVHRVGGRVIRPRALAILNQ